MNLPVFKQDRACAICPLHQTFPDQICVPTIQHTGPGSGGCSLVFIVSHPHALSVRSSKPIAGQTLSMLKVFTDFLNSHTANIYHTSLVRCGTPANDPPGIKNTKLCTSSFLLPDLSAICRASERTAVVCLGSGTAPLFLRLFGLKDPTFHTALSLNTSTLTLPDGPSFTFFATYSPDHVVHERPLIHAVYDHMRLVRWWLDSRLPAITEPHLVPPRNPPCNPSTSSRISTLDTSSFSLSTQANPSISTSPS